MPVIVVGADTPLGDAVVDALGARDGEIRVFVSDVDRGLALKDAGLKVAIGDVSDPSHVGGAALRCFSAVLLPEAAHDDRERSFAATPDAVLTGWAEALRDAGVRRAIVVDDPRIDDLGSMFADAAPEVAVVPLGDAARVAAEVARLDDLASLDG
ncbi:MAG: NAD(P)H-binding protein [Acidimicrobiia bacterium]|nr:NAD(P)H-binding protein [Acidimicrobiia bacterium]